MQTMRTKLFKIPTVVVHLLITAVVILGSGAFERAWGQGAALNLGNLGAPDPLGKLREQQAAQCIKSCKATDAACPSKCLDTFSGASSASTTRCDKAGDNLRDARKAIALNCGTNIAKCVSQNALCSAADDSEGTNVAAGVDTTCSDILTTTAKACPYLNGGTVKDATELRKDADDAKNDAQKNADNLQDRIAKDQTNLQNLTTNYQLKAAADLVKFNQQQLDATNQLQAAEEKISMQKAQALSQTRAKLQQLDTAYAALRDKIRRDSDAVAKAQVAITTTCRAYAMQQYENADKQIQQRVDQINSTTSNQGSFTNASSFTNQTAALIEQQRQQNYAAFYNQCVSGIAPEGQAAKAAVDAAINDQNSDNKQAQDQAAIIEEQRKSINIDLNAALTDASFQLRQVAATTKQAMDTLAAQYNIQKSADSSKYNSDYASLQSEIQRLQQQVQTASQDLYSKQVDSANAAARVKCASSTGGSTSQKTADERIKKLGLGAAAVQDGITACHQLKDPACILDPDLQKTCKDIQTAQDTGGSDASDRMDELLDDTNSSGGTGSGSSR